MKILLSAILLLMSGFAQAECRTLSENKQIQYVIPAESGLSLCLDFSNFSNDKVIIAADPVISGFTSPNQIAYTTTFTTDGFRKSGRTHQDGFYFTKSGMRGKNAKLTIVPDSQYGAKDHHYTFNIIHGNDDQGMNIIYISLRAIHKEDPGDLKNKLVFIHSNGITIPIAYFDPVAYYVDLHGELPQSLRSTSTVNDVRFSNSQQYSKVRQFSIEGYATNTAARSSESEASQCNNSNRPPEAMPYGSKEDNKHQQLDLNKLLRQEERWQKTVSRMLATQPGAATTATYYRLYTNHQMGGALDVKSSESPWAGNEDLGNFLYGAVMQVHGFSLDSTHRYAAAYQALQNGKANGENMAQILAQGLINFVTKSGNGPGDAALESRGYRYAEEVYQNNKSDQRSSSCKDQKTVNAEGGSGNSNSGGSGDGGYGGYDGYGGYGGYGGGWEFCTQYGQVCTTGGCNYWRDMVPCH
ncbi:hypothetical protein CWC22_006760 [Pseudoalteromonas rubra]|uniref:Uncharacterized protein n=1 Tax=Pseudoalteromonas rubra TaxID=43658 RepID=A0A7S7YSG1_9GAMM|nr:polymorphic toxin type 44 domain-containing protein [Pseudoalteromonas rubra]QPB82710.1 hypothetical protein CWC22_006760 [Pseudoalteromonas rubra]